ncbi:MAG TPA: helix-turn-helix transcriptional regulator [Blastocatellia bacterium]|nr:helix-turn-helix transcriptional regulator [Blastocatellia bacterium]
MSIRFGEYLKQSRLNAKMTQKEAAAQISRLGHHATQGLIAQYESGRITDPDPAMLLPLATIYNLDYMMVVLQLIRDKYIPKDDLPQSGLIAEQLRLWEAGLKRFPAVGEVEGMEERQLRAKALMVSEMEVLDVEGSAEWQKRFPGLHEMWLVAPDFLDAKEPIRSSVIHNLKRGVNFVYFVREAEIKKGGKFWLLQRQLASIDDEITAEIVHQQTLAIPLGEEELRWIDTDLVIANPLRWGQSVGYTVVRQDGAPKFSVRLATADLEKIVALLMPWISQKPGAERVVPFPDRSKGRLIN